MAIVESSQITVPFESSRSHLTQIASLTTHRFEKICADKITAGFKKNVLRELTQTNQSIVDSAARVKNETDEEYTRRVGWMIEATAIEILGSFSLISDPERILWKKELSAEILQAKEKSRHNNLPGIKLKVVDPYGKYFDRFSTNRVVIEFSSQKSTKFDLPLHVASTISDLVEAMGSFEAVQKHLGNYEPLPSDPIQATLELIVQLTKLNNMIKNPKEHEHVSFQSLKKRFDLLMQVTLGNEIVRRSLLVTHLKEHEFHALFLQVKNLENNTLYTTMMQFQPEEVTDGFWNFLKNLTPAPQTVPVREACLIPQRRRGDQHVIEIGGLGDWEGIKVPKIDNGKRREKVDDTLLEHLID